MNTKGHDLFVSRLYDALERKEALTSFLSPAEQKLAEVHLQHKTNLFFWGGYASAERKQLCLSESGRQASDVLCLHDSIRTTHPKVLGRILHAGIDRSCIGDILCTDQGLFVFCRSHMAQPVMDAIQSIDGTPVRLQEYDGPIPEVKKEQEVRIQSPSLRLDAAVAALVPCSRTAAREKLRLGHVKVDDIPQTETRPLKPGQYLSIRECGRFRFEKEAGTTRKGKMILVFQKRL